MTGSPVLRALEWRPQPTPVPPGAGVVSVPGEPFAPIRKAGPVAPVTCHRTLARPLLTYLRWGISGPSLIHNAAQPTYSAGAALYISGTPTSKMDAPNKNPANRAGLSREVGSSPPSLHVVQPRAWEQLG